MTDHPLDPFGLAYLRLALEINKHIDDYTEGYYGPAALRDEVNASPLREPGLLLSDVQRLRDAIPTDDPNRAAFLGATFKAIECSVRMLNGETFDFLDEVHHLFDIRPRHVPETEFEAAHRLLDDLLPKSAKLDLPGRLDTWRKAFRIDPTRALELLELARAETRRRTAQLFDLPDDEGVEIRLVNNQPWSAYNWYLGNGRSLIEFNTDLPLSALDLTDTFAHEGYPGHHTEAMLKERDIFRRRGYGEQGVIILNSPAAVISEGIATTAAEIIFPGNELHEWNVEVMLPAAGLPLLGKPEQLRGITDALEALRYVMGNAAILYHTGQLDKAATIDYIQTYALSTPERAAKRFSFIAYPLYRAYTFTYTTGYDLIAASNDRMHTFRRLLTEQALPSQI